MGDLSNDSGDRRKESDLRNELDQFLRALKEEFTRLNFSETAKTLKFVRDGINALCVQGSYLHSVSHRSVPILFTYSISHLDALPSVRDVASEFRNRIIIIINGGQTEQKRLKRQLLFPPKITCFSDSLRQRGLVRWGELTVPMLPSAFLKNGNIDIDAMRYFFLRKGMDARHIQYKTVRCDIRIFEMWNPGAASARKVIDNLQKNNIIIGIVNDSNLVHVLFMSRDYQRTTAEDALAEDNEFRVGYIREGMKHFLCHQFADVAHRIFFSSPPGIPDDVQTLDFGCDSRFHPDSEEFETKQLCTRLDEMLQESTGTLYLQVYPEVGGGGGSVEVSRCTR